MTAAAIAAWIGIVVYGAWWLMFTFASDGGWRWQLDLYFARTFWAFPNTGYFINSPGTYADSDIAWVQYDAKMTIFVALLKLAIGIGGLVIMPIAISAAHCWLKENIDNASKKQIVLVATTWTATLVGSYEWINYTLYYFGAFNYRHTIDFLFMWSKLASHLQGYRYWTVSINTASIAYGLPAYFLSSAIKWTIFFGGWAVIIFSIATIYYYLFTGGNREATLTAIKRNLSASSA